MAITDFVSSSAGGVLAGNDMDKMCGGFDLSRKQRLYGFGFCFGGGIILSLLSTIFLTTGNVAAFAVIYTIGNVVSLLGTGFLIGFSSQFKKMFDPVRLVASLVFIGTMVATIIVAFTIKSAILCLVLCGIQFFALFWYSASYIPFGRDMIKKLCGTVVS